MDKLTKYREFIQKLLQDYSNKSSDEMVEAQAIFDVERDHYQIVNVG
jgi:hypothetical protein